MAKAKKSAALARLVEAIEIKNPDGTTTMVPVSAEANSIANKIMASQMRALMQKSIEKFMSIDHMTPKELKEFTEAARNIAEFSGTDLGNHGIPQGWGRFLLAISLNNSSTKRHSSTTRCSFPSR